jgi:hypothetical protein
MRAGEHMPFFLEAAGVQEDSVAVVATYRLPSHVDLHPRLAGYISAVHSSCFCKVQIAETSLTRRLGSFWEKYIPLLVDV